MRIVLCDDDQKVLDQLESYLREYFEECRLPQPEYAAYLDGETLLAGEDKVDIAFLDVEMPGINGIQAGERLKQTNPYVKILILTAFPDYLDEAMKFHVFRYLSKPLDKNRLFRNMRDALYQYEVDTKPVHIETKEGVFVCRADEIVCIEAVSRKVLVHTTDGVYESVLPMKHWLALLEIGSFYQTHRSYIVNMKYVSSFSRDLVCLALPGGEQKKAYLTRRAYSKFKDAHLLYLEAMK